MIGSAMSHYRIIEKLGQGGMGEVFLAHDTSLDRKVALSSIESGRYGVYVTTFPERRQTWQLMTEGGHVLSWRNDGREILVATLSGHMAAYPVSTESGFTSGAHDPHPRRRQCSSLQQRNPGSLPDSDPHESRRTEGQRRDPPSLQLGRSDPAVEIGSTLAVSGNIEDSLNLAIILHS